MSWQTYWNEVAFYKLIYVFMLLSGGFNVEFKHGGFLSLSRLNTQNKESFKLLVVIVNRSINVKVF